MDVFFKVTANLYIKYKFFYFFCELFKLNDMQIVLIILFIFSVLVVFYAYLGYGLLLFLLVKLKRAFKKNRLEYIDFEPDVTLLVAAYNEEDFIRHKIENSLSLDYPNHKLKLLFVTDGSSDRTPEIVKEYPQIQLLHQPERGGKIAAVERTMPQVRTEIVVFTDANTLLNKEAIRKIVRHYADPKVGVVSGEKRIKNRDTDEAAGAGEGLYWKYESRLKKWDYELYSVVGAAGELFSIRTELYKPIPRDSLIEDFYMTLQIAKRGYKIAYEPEAYALEDPSASVGEELKRKIRIAAGGIQSVVRMKELLNPFRYGLLSFQYISHRVLRWTIAPIALPLIFITNLLLMPMNGFFYWLFWLQCAFYIISLVGYWLESKNLRFKLLFVPYYFCMMNYAVYRGFFRYMRGSQSVLWEKARRRDQPAI